MHRVRHLIISAVVAFALFGGLAPVTQTVGQATSGRTSAAEPFSTSTRSAITPSTVVNGVVYVGSDDYKVYALNASNGAKIWSHATGDSVEASPAVVNAREPGGGGAIAAMLPTQAMISDEPSVPGSKTGGWGQAQEVPGTATLNKGGSAEIGSVSCASPGNCGAGGDYGDASGHMQAFVVSSG